MRILDRKQLFFGLTACTTLALAGPATSQTSTQVETFTAGGVATFSMPGTPTSSGVTFATNASIQSVDFAPGSVGFNGQPVDFDGKEASFLSPASQYTANPTFPNQPLPAIVAVTGTGTVRGGVGGGGGGGCLVVGPGVPLGPTFSPTHLDLAVGGGVPVNAVVPSWTSSGVPQLNGHAVTVETTTNITSVDAVNGIVNFTMSGRILARNDSVPALSTLGLICLATGLFGLAILALRRRAPWGRTPSA
jgi:hypothetical protein